MTFSSGRSVGRSVGSLGQWGQGGGVAPGGWLGLGLLARGCSRPIPKVEEGRRRRQLSVSGFGAPVVSQKQVEGSSRQRGVARSEPPGRDWGRGREVWGVPGPSP